MCYEATVIYLSRAEENGGNNIKQAMENCRGAGMFTHSMGKATHSDELHCTNHSCSHRCVVTEMIWCVFLFCLTLNVCYLRHLYVQTDSLQVRKKHFCLHMHPSLCTCLKDVWQNLEAEKCSVGCLRILVHLEVWWAVIGNNTASASWKLLINICHIKWKGFQIPQS